MSEIKVYAVKRLWTCRMNYYRGHTTTVTARAVAALEENTIRILQTLWVQEGSIPVGIKLIERVAGGHVATGVELDILRDQSIVVMTRDCWRLFSDLEEKDMFHAYEKPYAASNLEDEVRRHLLRAAHAIMATRSSGGGLFRSLDRVMEACNPWRFVRDGAPWFTERSEDLLQDFAEAHTVAKRLLTVLSSVKGVRASWDEDRSGT